MAEIIEAVQNKKEIFVKEGLDENEIDITTIQSDEEKNYKVEMPQHSQEEEDGTMNLTQVIQT